jgi:putative ABC transport system substrate-binding protein
VIRQRATRRRLFLASALAALLAAPLDVLAQKTERVRRIGLLLPHSADARPPWLEAVYQGLRDLGHVEGRNLLIERRFAEGRDERLPALAAELVRANVEVLLAGGPAATIAAHGATATIPIVMAMHDPVEQGLIASLARPGGNMTGWCFLSADTAGKQLAVLKEAMPRLNRVAVLVNPGMAAHEIRVKHITQAAKAMGVQLAVIEIASAGALAPSFAAMSRDRVEAFILVPEPSVIDGLRGEIIGLAAQHRLPGMYMFSFYPDSGGLMSYGPDLDALSALWPSYVDRILKGARPGDLPVATPRKYELILNAKTARELGFTFPQTLLVAADRVIQ